MDVIQGGQQLSLEFKPHPVMRARRHAVLYGTLKLSGDLRIGRDLNSGERITVTISGPDGEVLCHHDAEIDYAFGKPIRERGDVIGVERVHKGVIE